MLSVEHPGEFLEWRETYLDRQGQPMIVFYSDQ